MFLFIMVIVMLNLLIAIMGNSYERVKESEEIEALKHRADVIIAEEAMMLADGTCSGDAVCKLFPEFLEVLDGLYRPKFAAEIAKQAEETELMHVETNECAKGTQREMARVDAMVAKVDAKVDAMAAQVAKGMAEMKAMVAQLVELQGR